MSLEHKKRNSLMRVVKPAQLIDRGAISIYIDRIGTPVCYCCDTITLLPIFRRRGVLWAVYCLNCGITRDTIGTCLHLEGEDMSKRMINPHENLK